MSDPRYPLAGHSGHCAKVVQANLAAKCTCGHDKEAGDGARQPQA